MLRSCLPCTRPPPHPRPPGRLLSPGGFSRSLGGLVVLAVLARAGCVFFCCPRSWPHSAHLVLGLGQPLASLYSLKPPSELRFVFNSQLISRSKKIEIEESKRPSGGPVLILREVSLWAGGKGLSLGCSLWSRRGAGTWLQTPPSITRPEMQLGTPRPWGWEAASAPSSRA